MNNPYAKYLPQGAASGTQPDNPYGGYVVGRPRQPTPLDIQREERAEQREVRAENRDQRAIANDSRSLDNTRFDNISSMRKEFTSRKEVQDFQVVLPQVASAMEIARNPSATGADDLNLIYTFGKVMDPGSVVREGELALASGTGSWAQNLEGAISRLRSGDRLPSEVRRNLVESMRRRGIEMARSYNLSRRDYMDRARRFGFNPADVVGQHPATPFQQSEADFTGHTIGNLDGTVGTRPEGYPGPGAGGAPGKQYHSLSADNLADVLTGLSGGSYIMERDGLFYTPPGGKRERVDLADGIANSDEYRDAYKAKFGDYPLLQVSVEGGTSDPSQLPVERGRGDVAETADAFIRGAADTVALGGADEISAAARTVFGSGTMRQNLRGERAVNAYDEEHNWGARTTGQLAGGFILPMGRAGGIPAASDLAKIGAGYSAAYGFGSADGSLTDRLIAAGTNAPIGAATGYGLGRLAQGMASRAAPPTGGSGHPLIEAARRQDVPVTVADAYPAARSTFGFLESVPVAGGAARNALGRGQEAIERRVAETGGGAVVDRGDLGNTVQDAGRRFISRSRTARDRLYSRAAQLSSGQRITPSGAVRELDAQLADLTRTPQANAAKIDILRRLRADMVNDAGAARALDVDSIRELRTAMRDELDVHNLRASDAERRVNMVMDAANADITQQLTGPALRAYQRADRFNRERTQMVDDVVKRFIGSRSQPMSGEQTVGKVEAMARPQTGDAARLQRMVATLTPEERTEVAGTITSQLGRRGADGDNAFSAQRFFSDIQRFSPDARRVIWGEQGARDLADLARVAEARGGVLGRLNNSRSGQVSNWFATLRGVLSGGGAGAGLGAVSGFGAGAGAATGASGVAAAIGASWVTARLLGSRHVVAALGAAARANTPAARAVVVQRLGQIAARQPALRAELLPIQRALTATLEGTRPALAANEREGDR